MPAQWIHFSHTSCSTHREGYTLYHIIGYRQLFTDNINASPVEKYTVMSRYRKILELRDLIIAQCAEEAFLVEIPILRKPSALRRFSGNEVNRRQQSIEIFFNYLEIINSPLLTSLLDEFFGFEVESVKLSIESTGDVDFNVSLLEGVIESVAPTDLEENCGTAQQWEGTDSFANETSKLQSESGSQRAAIHSNLLSPDCFRASSDSLSLSSSSSIADLSWETASSASTGFESLSCSEENSFLFGNTVLARDWLQAALIEVTFVADASETSKEMSKNVSGSKYGMSGLLGPLAHSKNSYLEQAAHYIKLANEYENCCEYEGAFHSYKSCIEILLRGVASENDSEKRAVVSDQVTEYITIASQILLNFIQTDADPSLWLQESISKSFSELVRPCDELKFFRILKVLSQNMVVEDKNGEVYFLKVIRKPLEGSYNFRNVPLSVKSMAKIVKFYDLPSCYIFCIEYLANNLVSFGSQNNWQVPCRSFTNSAGIIRSNCSNSVPDDAKSFYQHLTLDGNVSSDSSEKNFVTDRFDVQQVDEKPACDEFEIFVNELEESLSNSFGQTLTDERLRKNLRRKMKEAQIEFFETSKSQSLDIRNGYNSADQTPVQSVNEILDLSPAVLRANILQLVECFQELHELNLSWGTFTPKNLTLDNSGVIRMTHCFNWLSTDYYAKDVWDYDVLPFVAPEISENFIFQIPDSKSDVFSLGAVIYTLITNRLLINDFPGHLIEEMTNENLGYKSCSLSDLLKKMLAFDPKNRLTLEQVKEHPFFNEEIRM